MKENNNTAETYNLNGRLILSEDKYEYILKENESEENLSIILDNLSKVNKNISIHIFNDYGNTYISRLDMSGNIHKELDNNNVLSWFIDDTNLDEFLFNHTGYSMDIKIDVLDMGAEK